MPIGLTRTGAPWFDSRRAVEPSKEAARVSPSAPAADPWLAAYSAAVSPGRPQASVAAQESSLFFGVTANGSPERRLDLRQR